jgi:wobble nucleotide-excising tRNase
MIYGENGRGKTTLSSVLRSLGTGDPSLVLERHRLGASHPPHAVLGFSGALLQFQNGAWSAPMPQIAIFDDAFVAANVCSGVEIGTGHRQNLHELILGAQGVALNEALLSHVACIEEHNRALADKANAIPAAVRGNLSVDEFCALAADPEIEASLAAAERNLAAARSSDAIRTQPNFLPIGLPRFDTDAINSILARTLPELEAEAVGRIRVHLRNLGRGGEAWVGDGMGRIAAASQDHDHEVCPFCAQDLTGSPLIQHYQVYFSEAYDRLKAAITQTGQGINNSHGGEMLAAFERSVRVAVQSRTFWNSFTDVPEINVDTATVLRAWTSARDSVLVDKI